MGSGSRAPNPYGLLWNLSPRPENNMKSYGIDGQSATCIHTKSGPRASKPYEFIWNLSLWSKNIFIHIESVPRAPKPYEIHMGYGPGAHKPCELIGNLCLKLQTHMNAYGLWAQGRKTIRIHMESEPRGHMNSYGIQAQAPNRYEIHMEYKHRAPKPY